LAAAALGLGANSRAQRGGRLDEIFLWKPHRVRFVLFFPYYSANAGSKPTPPDWYFQPPDVSLPFRHSSPRRHGDAWTTPSENTFRTSTIHAL